MRKVIFTVMAVLGFTFANAQEQTAKGKWLIEANTGFGGTDTGNTSFRLSSHDGNTAWNLGAEGGYFVMDNLAVKAGLGYGDNGNDFANNIFSYKVGAKYYLLNKFPLEVSYNGASIKGVNESPSYIVFQGGYAWFVGNTISVELGIRYNATLNEYFSKSIFQFNIGFALHF